MPSEILLIPAELAKRWATSVDTLANWRHLKRGPRYVKISGTKNSIRYRLADIEKYEKEREKL